MKKRKKIIENYDYIYYIIEFWLSDEKYENYLLSLIEKLDEEKLNSFLVYKDKDEQRRKTVIKKQTLIEIVLEKLIESCKDELINQKKDIVRKEYYIRIFKAIYNSDSYNHQMDIVLSARQQELLNFVKQGKFKAERKQQIYEVINSLYEKPENKVEKNTVDTEEQLKYFDHYLMMSLGDNEREDYCNDKAIISSNKQYAYSISFKENGITSLRIHVLDVESLIYDNTPLYLEMKKNNRLNEELINIINLRLNRIFPTITYQIDIDSFGKIVDFDIIKSIIYPKREVDDEILIDSVSEESMFFNYVKTYKRLNSDTDDFSKITLKEVDKYFIELFSIALANYLKRHDLPAIYKVQPEVNKEEVANQLTNLNAIMYNLEEMDFQIIYNIICNTNNPKARYSLKEIGCDSNQRKKNLHIVAPFSFVGLKLQQILIDFKYKRLPKELIIERHLNELLEILNYYNKILYNVTTEEKALVRKK